MAGGLIPRELPGAFNTMGWTHEPLTAHNARLTAF